MSDNEEISTRDIIALLDEQHLPHANQGFPLLVEAIKIVCNDPELRKFRKIMVVYEMVAASFQQSASCVERSIRGLLSKLPYKTKNGHFIYWAVDKLCYHL